MKAFFLGLFIGSTAIFAKPVSIQTAPSVVNASEVLSIGPLHLSQYRMEKNFARAFGVPSTSPSDPDKICAWFERFLAQQVLTAQALQLGYANRSEVLREVSRMERHMLTQVAGPFYENLFSEPPIADEELKQEYGMIGTLYEVSIVELSEKGAFAILYDSSSKTTALSSEQVSTLAEARRIGTLFCFEGTLSWPYLSYMDIAPLLKMAEKGKWYAYKRTSGSILCFTCRAITTVEIAPWDRGEAAFRQQYQEYRKQWFAEKRRQQLLLSAHCEIARETAAEFLELIPSLQNKDQTMRLPLPVGIAEKNLCSYVKNGEKHELASTTFAEYLNSLYIRQLARTSMELGRQIENYVVAELDFAEAKTSSVCETPKFKEDRANFLAYQALALFEKEHVVPLLGISEADVESYYNSHKEQFRRPVELEGELLYFPTREAALRYSPDEEISDATQVWRRENLVIKEGQVPGDLGILAWTAFAVPPGTPVGPFQRNGEFVVWTHSRVHHFVQLPLADVVTKILKQLEDDSLPALELQLAHKAAKDLPVEDRIDYANYHVTQPVSKPWRT